MKRNTRNTKTKNTAKKYESIKYNLNNSKNNHSKNNSIDLFKNFISRKSIQLLFAILVIALILRIPNIDKSIVFDEYIQTRAVMYHNSVGLDKGTEIVPLTTWTRILFAEIFGMSTQLLKSVSLLFGLLSIVLIYYLARELYGEKAALWASLLVAISAWHILASTSISFDGPFLTFYYLLTIFLYVKYIKYNKMIYLYLTGVAFGLAMLTKLNAILILPILIIYYIYLKRKTLRKNYRKIFLRIIKDFAIIGGISVAVFSIFPILAYFTDISYFYVTLQHHTQSFTKTPLNILLSSIQYMLFIFWAGPLFLGLYLLSLFKYEHEDSLIHIWVFVIFLFFTFGVKGNFKPLERYFLVILPTFCIMGGKYLSKFFSLYYSKFKNKRIEIKRDIIKFSAFFLLFLVILFIFNFYNTRTIPFYPKSGFFDSIIALNWSFIVPFTGDQGPIGFYVSFISILVSFALAGLFGMIYLFSKKIKHKALMLILFLAVSFAFNIFMYQEMTFSTTHQNIDAVTKESVAYALNADIKTPVYVFRNYALEYYLQPKYSHIIQLDYNDEYSSPKVDMLLKNGGSLLFIDFPYSSKTSDLWVNITNECTLNKEFSSKGFTVAYLFVC